MSLHINLDLDEELEQPPPSAQGASWAPPAAVRRNGSAVLLPAARRRDERFSSKASVAHALTTSPAVADQSTSKLQNERIPARSSPNPSSSSSNRNATNPPFQPLSPSSTAPATRTFFDPWNSSSTGHQRAENRLSGSTSWRDSRNLKLGEQYKAGLAGGKRVTDTVGAGSEEFGKDGRKENGGWERGAKGLRTGGQKSLIEVWGASKAATTAQRSSQEEKTQNDTDEDAVSQGEDDIPDIDPNPSLRSSEKQMFEGLCFYLNGSTAPRVSDHKLKHLLSTHGAKHSIALGRRIVTHVILGTMCGGGLAASKIQKEVTKTRGKGVRFITADWVLESIKAGRRLPESQFSPLKLAPKSQNSVVAMVRSSKPPAE